MSIKSDYFLVEGTTYPGALLTSNAWKNNDLQRIEFRNCTFEDSDFRFANLTGTQFVNCNLTNCTFQYADLTNTEFDNCILKAVDWRNSQFKNVQFFPPAEVCPSKGSFVGYKKVKGYDSHGERYEFVLTLSIPEDALRLNSPGSRKCRASFVSVISVDGPAKELGIDTFWSYHDPSFSYKVGSVISCDYLFCTDIRDTCASGIHFFMTEVEAKSYEY